MIYKIFGWSEEDFFERIVKFIQPEFSFVFYNDIIYIALMHYSDLSIASDKIKELKKHKDCIIEEITLDNLMKEDYFIIDWCKNFFVKIDKEKYEEKEQHHLQEVWLLMDNLEKELSLKMKAKEEIEE